MSIYSFSQTNLFEQCPRKYQYKYLDKIAKEFESSPDLILGQSVHGALEWLYNQINIFKIPEEEKILEKFKNLWDAEFEKLEKQSKEILIKWDYTLEDYFRRGQVYLQNHYAQFFPFEGVKIISTEEMMVFELDENKKFRWIIDRLDKEGEDTFVINDYKTNKNLPSQEKEQYFEQLSLYALGVSQKYAKYYSKIKARLFYLHFDIVDQWEVTPEIIDRVKNKYIALIDQIEHKKFAYNMGDKKSFECKESNLCKYCEYMSICPLWTHMKFDDEVIAGDLGEKTIKGLVDEYGDLNKIESESKAQKENIKEILIDYAYKHGLEKLFGNQSKLSISQTEHMSIQDKEVLKAILDQLGVLDQAMELDRFKLMKLVKQGRIDENKLGWSAEKKISWSLRSSKL
jgi:RecB family exonuclease